MWFGLHGKVSPVMEVGLPIKYRSALEEKALPAALLEAIISGKNLCRGNGECLSVGSYIPVTTTPGIDLHVQLRTTCLQPSVYRYKY